MTTLFIFEAESCKNFKAVFLKTLFFKSSTSNAYSESFALKRLGAISIDWKSFFVLESGYNSIPKKWDLFRWMYTHVFFEIYTKNKFKTEFGGKNVAQKILPSGWGGTFNMLFLAANFTLFY